MATARGILSANDETDRAAREEVATGELLEPAHLPEASSDSLTHLRGPPDPGRVVLGRP